MTQQNIVAGIDIGGTKIAAGLVNERGNILTQSEFPTDSKQGIPNVCDRITEALEEQTRELGLTPHELRGIGIGCPGPMDRQTGEIQNPYTLPGWESGSLTDTLRERIPLPVILENDADAALLGECFVGAGKGFASVVMLTFGTGVGGAILSDGQIVRGVEDSHPEIGLMPVLPDEAVDYSGVPGSLESIASGSGITKAGVRAGYSDSRAVFAAAQQGNTDAQVIIDRAIRAVSLACLSLSHTVCPERIILGGGLMDEHYEQFESPCSAAIAKATLLPPARIRVVKAELGNRAGLVGAASLILNPVG